MSANWNPHKSYRRLEALYVYAQSSSLRNTMQTVESQTTIYSHSALIRSARFRKQVADGATKVRSSDMPIVSWENVDYNSER
ncbi:hypothetical protein GALMADRAFT_229031 [Galerina marginata CBS 339.88]|uniref:Uncharacterized protein n=1 Tax=Galerina marginata (strain CBS 339.88) TaxID=685588 RepID=A0A067SML2_GALM3|nr:hypothetical protein GALMADRAFT_229031 [Galerina marginata CBS 339.88]